MSRVKIQHLQKSQCRRKKDSDREFTKKRTYAKWKQLKSVQNAIVHRFERFITECTLVGNMQINDFLTTDFRSDRSFLKTHFYSVSLFLSLNAALVNEWRFSKTLYLLYSCHELFLFELHWICLLNRVSAFSSNLLQLPIKCKPFGTSSRCWTLNCYDRMLSRDDIS